METINIFYPVFKINKHFFHSWAIFHTCNTSVGPHLLWLVINIIKITLPRWGEINSQFIHFRFKLLETFPKSLMAIIWNCIHNMLIIFKNRVWLLIQSFIVLSGMLVSFIKDRNSWNKIFSLSLIIIIISVIYFLNVKLTGSKRFFPILFIKIEFISLINSTRTWSWISIFDFSRWLIIFVTLNFKSSFKCTPELFSLLGNFSDHSINHLFIY